MAQYRSSSGMFPSAWDSRERDVLSGIFKGLLEMGYEKYVAPCAGAFRIAYMAAQAGFPPDLMRAADVTLYSSAIGYLLSGQSFSGLDLHVGGQPYQINFDSPARAAAEIIWVEYLSRMETKPAGPYWRNIVKDLRYSKASHISKIQASVEGLLDDLSGIHYRADDWRAVVEAARNEESALIFMDPPAVRGQFEQFFNTNSKVAWLAPEYKIYDPIEDNKTLRAIMHESAAVLVWHEKRPKGASTIEPFYGRYLGRGEYSYLMTNRPQLISKMLGQERVAVTKEIERSEKLDLPVLPQDYMLTEESEIEVVKAPPAAVEYYKDLWRTELPNRDAKVHGAIVIDGYLAGVFGYGFDSVVKEKSEKTRRHISIAHIYGAPHDSDRLAILLNAVVITESAVEELVPLSVRAVTRGVMVALPWRYPENELLERSMELARQSKSGKHGFRLTYRSDVRSESYNEQLEKWLEV